LGVFGPTLPTPRGEGGGAAAVAGGGGGGGGGERYSTIFYMGRLRPKVQPLTLLYTILTERCSFRTPLNEKGTS